MLGVAVDTKFCFVVKVRFVKAAASYWWKNICFS